jgi:hypothetical protein
VYFPDSGLIIAVGLNSNLEPTEDDINSLARTLHDTLAAHGLLSARR